MAHLVIAKNAKFATLVELMKKYTLQAEAETDPFAKAESIGFVHEIEAFCAGRGMDYLDRVMSETGLFWPSDRYCSIHRNN